MEKKKTLVIGASENPARYSFMAVQKLNSGHHPVIALGAKKGKIGNIDIVTERPALKDIDTVTLYINPTLQQQYYEYIMNLHPKRIIFNPGTENETLEVLAQKNNIVVQEACTLVLLGTGQY